MTTEMKDVLFDALASIYGRESRFLFDWALVDELITRREFFECKGESAPIELDGLVFDEERYVVHRNPHNCTCGNCRYCCGSGDEDDRTDEEKYAEEY